MGYYMGIDIGTSASKGVLVNNDGDIVAQHSCIHGMEMPRPGYFEHDAEKVWWGDFCVISNALIGKSSASPKEILGVGVSTLGADCVPVDENCNPLRKAILYGIDARASKELEEITERIGKERLKELRANPLCSEDVFAKSLWIKNNEPEVYKRTYKFCTGSTYLTAKLTGRFVLDNYLAQLCYFPAYRPDGTLWNNIVEMFVDPAKMPYTAGCTDIAGYVTEKAAMETGLAVGTPVVTGTDDAAAEAFSAGIVEPGDLMIMLGSSMYLICLTEKPISDKRLWNSEYLIPGIHSIQGATNNMGTVTKWMKETLFPDFMQEEKECGKNAYERMAEEGKSIAPGAGGLIALPYLAGERTPINDPGAAGALLGIRLDHDRRHIYRAMIEGIAYGIAQHIDILRENDIRINKIVAIGGGIKNPLLMQIIADVTGEAINTPATTIGASYGDAILAAIGCGGFASFGEAKKVFKSGKLYNPNIENKTVYAKNMRRFTELYSKTRGLVE